MGGRSPEGQAADDNHLGSSLATTFPRLGTGVCRNSQVTAARLGPGVCHLRAWEDGSDEDYLGSARGVPRWFGGKESACQAGDMGLISGSGRSPGEGNGNPLQYSCLENPMDRGAYRPWGCKELDMTEHI